MRNQKKRKAVNVNQRFVTKCDIGGRGVKNAQNLRYVINEQPLIIRYHKHFVCGIQSEQNRVLTVTSDATLISYFSHRYQFVLP